MIGWFRGATLAIVVVVVWLAAAAVKNEPRVAFVWPPAFVSAREIVTYIVRVPRHPDNQRLIVVAVADDGVVVSEMQRELDGMNSRVPWNISWQLPVGRFLLIAAVFDAREQVGRATHSLTVLE